MQTPNPFMMAQQMAQQQPDIQKNPRAMEMLQVLLSGDARRGEELANNLLQTYGKTKEQGMQLASQRFGVKF